MPATLKWPNDVLVGDLKLAGILVERVEAPAGAAAVVGVGLNVSSTREELPVETATSLRAGRRGSSDRSALLVGGARPASPTGTTPGRPRAGRGLRPSYTEACSTLGREVRVDLPGGEPLRGRAVDVDDDGRLLVDDGRTVRALGAGDVVHVRPA